MSAALQRETFWRRRPVLVTGCTGLLGSWLTHELARLGAAVVGLVRDHVPHSNFSRLGLADRIVVVAGDVESLPILRRTLSEYEVDTVFHLAAQTIVPIANRDPVSTFETNIKGSWNLLEAARHQPTVKRIVVASSDKAYGAGDTLPYSERAPLRGSHPYDVSKSCADLLAGAYWTSYRLPVCITRCGNLFGGGDLNFSRLVPGTIRSAWLDEAPIIRSDGTLVRDYFYVKDAVDAYLMLAEQMVDAGCLGEAFNFSQEQPLSAMELVRLVLRLMGKCHLEPVVVNQAVGEIRNQYLTAAKAQRLLGWEPVWPLEAGLRETIHWYEEYFRDSWRVDHPAPASL
jgi:CDP-glucose 4,6-dehydratase